MTPRRKSKHAAKMNSMSCKVLTMVGLSCFMTITARPMHQPVIPPTAPLVSGCGLGTCLEADTLLSSNTNKSSSLSLNATQSIAASLLSLMQSNIFSEAISSSLPPNNRLEEIPMDCSGNKKAFCYGSEMSIWTANRLEQQESSERPSRQVVWFAEEDKQRMLDISSDATAILLEGHRELLLLLPDEIGDDETKFTASEKNEEGDSCEEHQAQGEDEDEEYEEDDTTPGIDCFYREDWMDPKNVEASFMPTSCDSIHEIDPSTFSLVNCGSSRCVFQVQDGLATDVVIKIGMFNDIDYEQEGAYASAWKDTVIMERLGWSPNVLQLYGSCGTTQITEVAAGGNLLDFINVARHYPERSRTSPETKLKMAFHIMSAAADIHQLQANNEEGPWMVAHNDFFPHQMLIVDGRIKLNDFHLASFAKKQRPNDETCLEIPSDTDDHFDKTRAPEEIYFWYPLHPRDQMGMDRSKVDVWYAGQSLYHILTNRWMFEGMLRNGLVRNILRADEAFDVLLPEEVQKEFSHPAEQAIVDAIEWVWSHKFWERPTAREVADFLEYTLEELYGEERSDGGLWHFDIPPLPEDYSYATAEEEYHNNLGCPLEDAECIKTNRDAMDDWSVKVF